MRKTNVIMIKRDVVVSSKPITYNTVVDVKTYQFPNSSTTSVHVKLTQNQLDNIHKRKPTT